MHLVPLGSPQTQPCPHRTPQNKKQKLPPALTQPLLPEGETEAAQLSSSLSTSPPSRTQRPPGPPKLIQSTSPQPWGCLSGPDDAGLIPRLKIFGNAKPNSSHQVPATLGLVPPSDKLSPPNTLKRKKKRQKSQQQKPQPSHLFFMELHRRAKLLQPSVKREGNS